jgi:cell division protein FtsI (penicillin-binding protein 3)
MSKKKFDNDEALPVIRAGNQHELTLICNDLGISNHSLTDEEWVRTAKSGKGVNWKKNIEGKDIVPDVTGMTFRDAIFLLEKSGLRVFYEGKGRVVQQSLNAGGRVSKGDRIFIKLS